MAYQSFPSSSRPNDSQPHMSPIEASSSQGPPPPPVHRTPVGMHADSNYSQMQSQRQYAQDPNNYSDYSPPGVTPGADNLGETAAGGGINGIAIGVASSHERESGVQAMRNVNNHSNGGQRPSPRERSPADTPFADQYAYDHPTPPRPIHSNPQYGSNASLGAGGMASAGMWSSNSSQQSVNMHSPSNAYPYSDNPYNRYSSSNLNLAPQMGQINPNDVADDDDWGITPVPGQQKRRSFAPFGSSSRDGTPGPSAGVAAGAAGAAGAAAGAAAARDGSGSYNAVPTGDVNQPELVREKSEWLDRQNHGRKKLMWIVASVIAFIVIGAIVGGVLGSVLGKKNGGDGGSSSSGSGSGNNHDPNAVAADNKDRLDINSSEIKALMNNANLHKVFPGMDYTPLNAQYPECLHGGPSQNNITRDIAVMSQLTNAVRLYGTDCNQTEMVIEAIDRLKLTDMKVWMGVWLGNNDTTNTRQVDQMWELIDKHGESGIFKGVIVGNEVLFRKDLTSTQLLKYITDIKKNITETHGLKNIPIAISDLGDNWTADMATKVDIVMSNVHPFFAGVKADVATAWTWTFWQTHDVILTKDEPNIKQIIAEVGWPSEGGNSCGEVTCTSDTQGSVAGIDEMNTFMEDWVCPSLRNGTEYFWFSAFDEPWKIAYNEKGKEWEDKWGLMDVNRNLKKGVKIPDCGGSTV